MVYNNEIDLDDIPPMIEDIVNNIIIKCKTDLEEENKTKKLSLDAKEAKIKEAYSKEESQLTLLQKSIDNDKQHYKKLNVQYILNKQKTGKIINESNNTKSEYQNLIKIYNTKISEYNKDKKILENKIEKEHGVIETKKDEETKTLKEEINVYNIEIDRIKSQKEYIEGDLQKELAQIIKDLELIDAKIESKNKIIGLLQLEIKKIEKGNSVSRRQIIKGNQIFYTK